MTILIKHLIVFSLFFSFTVQAGSIDYDCSVKEVILFSDPDDDEFIRKNLKKRFVLSIRESEVIETSISDFYESGTTIYNIYEKRDVFGTLRAEHDNFSENLFLHIDTGEAVRSVQGSHYSNAWLLDCIKQ